jgi:hypothetical protein
VAFDDGESPLLPDQARNGKRRRDRPQMAESVNPILREGASAASDQFWNVERAKLALGAVLCARRAVGHRRH